MPLSLTEINISIIYSPEFKDNKHRLSNRIYNIIEVKSAR